MELWKIVVILAIILYEFIICPRIIENSIYNYVKEMQGETRSIERLSRRESLYCVEYQVNGQRLRSNVRCNFLGQIVEWR